MNRLIKILGEIESLTDVRIVAVHALWVGPVGLLGFDFLTQVKQCFVKAEKLLFEGISLFGRCSWVVGGFPRWGFLLFSFMVSSV